MNVTPRRESVVMAAIATPEEAPLTAYENCGPDEAAISRMWNQLSSDQATRGVPFFTRALRFAVLMTGVIVAAYLSQQWLSSPEPLKLAREGGTLTSGERIATSNDSRSLVFEDSSEVHLAPHTELSVVSNDGQLLVLSLRTGSASFSVTPGKKRRWTIDAGALVVSVLGTEFQVERSHEATRVSVTRGQVAVHGEIPGRSVKLNAGESVESMPKQTPAESPSSFEHSSNEQTPRRLTTSMPSTPRSESDVSSDEQPRDRFALVEIEQENKKEELASSTNRSVPRVDTIHQLLQEADEHRTSGRPQEAAKILHKVVKSAPQGDARRALAALSHARLETDDSQSAALLLETMSDMPPSLRELALMRLVQALRGSGQAELAENYARVYLREFPGGPRAPHMTRLLQ